MKKRLLLAIIPALLVLSSCGVKPSVEAEPYFQEDTLAHNDVFDKADGGLLYKGSKAKAQEYDYVPNDGARPTVGIQTYDDGTNVSIRFVAAVNITGPLSDATAVWTRAMYKADGSKLKDFADKPCQKVYEEINDHGNALNIKTFNGMYETHYDYFVVYTMLNINKAEYANCYLNAYLTLNDGKQSKVLATKVVFDYYSVYTFEPSQRYFLRGSINGEQRDVAQDATTQGDNPQNNYASFTSSFTLGDEFVIVANDVANKRFKIYDSSCLTGTDNPIGTHFNDSNGKIKVYYADGNYVLYLNKSGELWESVNSLSRPLYVKVTTSGWGDANAWTMLYAYGFTGENGAKVEKWFELETSGNYLKTKVDVDTAVYTTAIVVRMNPDYSTGTWDAKWGQTGDLTIKLNQEDCAYVYGTMASIGASFGARD